MLIIYMKSHGFSISPRHHVSFIYRFVLVNKGLLYSFNSYNPYNICNYLYRIDSTASIGLYKRYNRGYHPDYLYATPTITIKKTNQQYMQKV